MKIKLLLAVILVLVFSSCGGGGGGSDESLTNNACGTISLPTKNLKIINGEACGSLGNSPVVRVVMYDSAGIALGYCTGTMLTSKDVLTAAHCVVTGTVSAAVIYGDAGNTKFAPVESIRRHPDYVPITRVGGTFAAFNDIAVYSLRENLNLPVLPIGTSIPVEGGDVIDIFGYGIDENGTLDFNELRSGEMLVDEVTTNHISTIFNGEGSNTCQGDSGGPAVININGQAAVVGVTSTGTQQNCLEGDNSLFINIQSPESLDFILSLVPSAGQV